MFRSLYTKLAVILSLNFLALAAIVIYYIGYMIDESNVYRLLVSLIAGGFACALIAGLLIFRVVTRHLRALARAVETYQTRDSDQPLRLAGADPNGDEIQRLSYAFQSLSERVAGQLVSLRQIDVKRREWLANVSHDLRTPLASMRGYLETLLLKEGTIGREEHRNYLEVACRQAERLAKLVADLFEFTKLDAREVKLNGETFPITELVQDVVQKFHLAAEPRGIRVEGDFSGHIAQVWGDISLIERLLDNLIENALRHTNRGGVVRVALANQGKRVAVRVSDTGIGIKPEDLPKVFDRYFQGDRNTGSPGGAGLGLAIAQRIASLHGSEVSVESQVGVGTTFYFDLATETA